MSKTKGFSKVLALVIMLALVIGILPMGAMAAATNTASFTFSGDTNVATAAVAGGGTGTLKIIDTDGPNVEGNTKSCQIELSPNSTATTATVKLKNSSNQVLETLTVTLRATTPSTTFVAEAETTRNGITYVFTFVMETSYTSGGTAHNSVYISLPDEGVSLGSTSSTSSPFTYAGATTLYSGFPQYVSLRLVPGGSSYDNVSDVQVAVTTGSTSGVEIEHQAGTYYTIYFPSNGSKAVFTVNYKLNGTSQSATTFSITMSSSSAAVSGSGIYAYLPAPGQFTNEGVNTGGWGDAFVSGSGALKDMVSNIATTGVSLGYFGGYVVLDMGENISDSANNMYGIDFITYGNAFINNSEPGCIQVAQAVGNDPGDANNDGVIWYDIAGSLYYDSDTDVDASLTYTNPHKSDDTSSSWPQSGTFSTTNSENDVPYTIDPSSTIHYVTYNTFHRHAWFPLWANYFVARTTGSGNNTVTIGPMDKANVKDETVTPNTTRSGFRFADYTRNTSSGSKLTLTGVLVGDATATTTSLYRFGYADVHPKYTSDTTHFDKAYNPYAFTSSDITSNNTWNTYLATANNGSPAGGGDPIDIAWAVHPAKYDHTVTVAVGESSVTYKAGTDNPNVGQPAGLSNIRFIRVYTGGAYINGIFGELSTEVCGAYKATGNGSGEPDSNLKVLSGGTTYVDAYCDEETTGTPNLSVINIPYTSGMTIEVKSGDDHVSVNGVAVTCTTSTAYQITSISSGNMYQIIAQNGTESPYIVLIKVS